MPSIIFKTNRNNLDIVAQGKYLPSLKEILTVSKTFFLAVLAWIFFRANNLTHAFDIVSHIFSTSIFSSLSFKGSNNSFPILILLVLFNLVEWMGREQQFAIAKLGLNWKRPIRWAFYYVIIFAIIYFGGKEQNFIYFQF